MFNINSCKIYWDLYFKRQWPPSNSTVWGRKIEIKKLKQIKTIAPSSVGRDC